MSQATNPESSSVQAEYTDGSHFGLLGDEPFFDSTSGPDPLAFDVIASDLATLIQGSIDATPMTVGIDGGWGTGKSSLMRRLDHELGAQKNVRTVWFNAWAAGPGSGLEGLVKTVLDKVDPNILRRTLRDRKLMSWLRVFLTIVAGWLKVGALVDGVWQELGLDPRSRNELGDLVKASVEDWLRQQSKLPEGQIFAVFIDDLDRCQPSTVLEIFEAIRLYLPARGFVFVLGYDRSIVSQSILQTQHYDATVTGQIFLEKVIQISYPIGWPTEGQANALFDFYLHGSRTSALFHEPERELILRQSARNPRRIKRFINNVVIEYRLDPDWKILGTANLVNVLILQEYCRDFLQLVRERTEGDAVQNLLQYVDARRAINRGVPRDTPEWQQRVEPWFRSYDLALPRPDQQPEALVSILDRSVPPVFIDIERDDGLIAIVRSLADPSAASLLKKLEQRPIPADTGASQPSIASSQAATAETTSSVPTPGRFRASSNPVALPNPSGLAPYHLNLDAVLPPASMAEIQSAGRITFHAIGNVGGVNNPLPQLSVARAMSNEVRTISPPPYFLYLLGDIVYFGGETANYPAQFYQAYASYQRPIFGIPGNHDASPQVGGEAPLTGFIRNFCARTQGTVTPESQGTDRVAMIQPNVYWTLIAPFVTLIGLFTNTPEGGYIDPAQAAWLASELSRAPRDRSLMVATHHPVYSMAQVAAGGSAAMGSILDTAFQRSGRVPDMVLASHVNNYQRFSRVIGDRVIPYVVSGAGGYWRLHAMARARNGKPLSVPSRLSDDVTLEAYEDQSHGFLRIEASPAAVTGTFLAVDIQNPSNVEARDQFSVSRAPRTMSSSAPGDRQSSAPSKGLPERREPRRRTTSSHVRRSRQ